MPRAQLRPALGARRDRRTVEKADNHWAEIRSGKVTYRIVGMPDHAVSPIDQPVGRRA